MPARLIAANAGFEGTPPNDGVTDLPTELDSPSSYAHVERTFSEFMLSDYGIGDGAPGIGPYDPSVFATSRPGNKIGSCQDCHMPDAVGKGCRFDAWREHLNFDAWEEAILETGFDVADAHVAMKRSQSADHGGGGVALNLADEGSGRWLGRQRH